MIMISTGKDDNCGTTGTYNYTGVSLMNNNPCAISHKRDFAIVYGPGGAFPGW